VAGAAQVVKGREQLVTITLDSSNTRTAMLRGILRC
jgi:hypothetical protein